MFHWRLACKSIWARNGKERGTNQTDVQNIRLHFICWLLKRHQKKKQKTLNIKHWRVLSTYFVIFSLSKKITVHQRRCVLRSQVVSTMYFAFRKRLQFNRAVCVKKETNEVNAEKRRKLNRGSRGRVSESQNTEI